jgi:hypothetical protein
MQTEQTAGRRRCVVQSVSSAQATAHEVHSSCAEFTTFKDRIRSFGPMTHPAAPNYTGIVVGRRPHGKRAWRREEVKTLDPVLIAALVSFALLVVAWLALPAGSAAPGRSMAVEQMIEPAATDGQRTSYSLIAEGPGANGSAR